MQITVEVPDELGRQLQQFHDRIPEVLERGLQELLYESPGEFLDEQEIMALLASQPTAAQILAIQPSPKFQAHVSELLAQSKAGTLAQKGEAELERYLALEHLVRLAKAHAYGQIHQRDLRFPTA
jgi:phage terminase Nu1 subunit (DNA packaging protein)